MNILSNTLLITFLALQLITATACAIEDGQPWGVANVGVALSFAPPADRNPTGQSFRTVNDTTLTLERLELQIAKIELAYGNKDQATSFDPANPPAPYTNCHAHHCHLPNGSTVDYDIIAQEMLSQSTASANKIAIPVGKTVTIVGDDGFSNFSWQTAERVDLDRGELQAVILTFDRLAFSASLTDANDQNTTVAFDLEHTNLTTTQNYIVKIGPDYDYKKDIQTAWQLDAAFADNIDWSALNNNPDQRAAFAQKIVKNIHF